MSREKPKRYECGYVNSVEATEGAENFINKIRSGVINMDIEPIEDTIKETLTEEKHFLSFNRFLESVNGRFVLECTE